MKKPATFAHNPSAETIAKASKLGWKFHLYRLSGDNAKLTAEDYFDYGFLSPKGYVMSAVRGKESAIVRINSFYYGGNGAMDLMFVVDNDEKSTNAIYDNLHLKSDIDKASVPLFKFIESFVECLSAGTIPAKA